MATLRLPRRATLVFALVVFAAGHVMAALGNDVGTVLSARVITALAAGAFCSVAAVVETQAAGPPDSSRALGVMMSGVGLATVAGVPLGSFAGQLLGWRGTFWGLGDPVRRRSSRYRAVHAHKQALARAVRPCRTTGDHDRPHGHPGHRHHPGHRRLHDMPSATFPRLATGRAGLPAWAVPLIFVVFGLGAIIGTNLAGRFADNRPVTTFITATAGTIVLMGLLVPLSTNAAALFVLMFLLAIAGMGIPPVGTGLAVRSAQRAPTLAAAVSVSAFNGGTATGTWFGATPLESTLGVLGP
ncbi:MFS transporter [Arthrobacter sp. CDRTa11]|uniref:MFS transporter n=1 Tax=Arthrobacter sp. CDRTa11 TaxID=2651199 RepID=UPI0022659FC0|nr:MFS transporter [Arthrobacter sp. CDRTa11]